MVFLVKWQTEFLGLDTKLGHVIILYNKKYENIFNFEQLTRCEQGKKILWSLWLITSFTVSKEALPSLFGDFDSWGPSVRSKANTALTVRSPVFAKHFVTGVCSQHGKQYTGDVAPWASGLLESAIDLVFGLANTLKQKGPSLLSGKAPWSDVLCMTSLAHRIHLFLTAGPEIWSAHRAARRLKSPRDNSFPTY